MACSAASSSEAVSAPANDSERSSTLTGRGLAVRAAAIRRGSTPFIEGPAITPISSPRCELERTLALNSAALRALALNRRSRCVWTTLIRMRGKREASSSRSLASSSSVWVIVLAATVAVRSAPVIASCAPITSPLRIRSSISPPPAVVPARQLTRPEVISQMRSLGSPAAHSCSPEANSRGRIRSRTASSSSGASPANSALCARAGSRAIRCPCRWRPRSSAEGMRGGRAPSSGPVDRRTAAPVGSAGRAFVRLYPARTTNGGCP